jgi:hypothetical protein
MKTKVDSGNEEFYRSVKRFLVEAHREVLSFIHDCAKAALCVYEVITGTKGFFFLMRIPLTLIIPPIHLLLDSAPNVGPLISRWEIDKFKIC